ncbi:MAG: hypothetical protein CSA45_03150 [Gammaproteobacteria bacterium]|nr:MAG: hypothetical protein CSA45_03150 [Gammaproteobacteria bacterium]
MKEYNLNLPLFITIIGILSALISVVVLMITGSLGYREVGQLAFNYSFITVPLAIIWYLFENYGWKSSWFVFLRKFLNIPPDISGRWEGTLDRVEENNPHGFVIEIKQTMTKLQVYTFSQNGKSESIIDNIVTDKMEDDFQLTYLWEGNAGKLTGINYKGGKFKGYTILALIENEKERKLVGEYFTDREPSQTKGYINVIWKSDKLKKEF